MWLLKLVQTTAIITSFYFLVEWTYFKTAFLNFVDEQKPFSYFLVVWGGTFFLAFLKGITPTRSISGKLRISYQLKLKLFTLCMAAFCCGFTLHALSAVSPRFDINHLDMPSFLPSLFLPIHFILVGWLFFTKSESQADRGLLLLLFFHTLNGAVFNTEFFLISAFACFTVLERLIENRGRLSLPPPLITISLSLFLIFAAVSGIMALNPVKSNHALTHVWVCTAILVLTVSSRGGCAHLIKLIGVTILSSAVVVVSVAVLLVNISLIIGPVPVFTTRLSIFFQHPNFLAPYFAMIAVLCTAFFFVSGRKKLRLCLIPIILLVIACLWLTDSRAGYLGFLAGLLALLALTLPIRAWAKAALSRIPLLSNTTGRQRGHLLLAGCTVIIAVLSAAAVFQSKPILSAIRESTRLRRALDYRLDAWTNSLMIIQDNKLNGIGMDTFMSVKKFKPGSKFAHEKNAPHPHNMLLYIAQSCGLPALVAFFLLLGGYLRLCMILIRKIPISSLRMLVKGCVSASVVLLFCGLADLGLSLLTLFPGPLWLFIGIVSALYNEHVAHKKSFIRLNGLLAVLPAAAVTMAAIYGSYFPIKSRVLLKRSYMIEANGNTHKAILLAEKAHETDPLNDQACDFLMRRYIHADSHEKAYYLIERASRLQPENAAFHMSLGKLFEITNEQERAATEYEKALELDHGSDELHRYYANLINTEIRCGRIDKVNDHLKTAIRRDIAVINLIKWKTKPLPGGRDDQFLNVGGEEGISIHLDDLLDELHQELYTSYESGKPQDRFDWFSLFQAFKNAFAYDRALDVLDDVEEVFGDLEKDAVQILREGIAREEGDLEQGKDSISGTVESSDKNIPETETLFKFKNAQALIDEGKLDEAIEVQKKIISSFRDYKTLQEDFIIGLDNLMKTYDLKGELKEKVKPLSMRLFFSKDKMERVNILLDLASSLRACGRFGEAEESLLEIVELLSASLKKIGYLEQPDIKDAIRKCAYQMADLYREDLGLSGEKTLRRIWNTTDFFSSNPVRLVFKNHFLVKNGMPERTAGLLELALKDNPASVLLLELKIECCHLIDDLPGLRIAYNSIVDAKAAREEDLDARVKSLFTAVFDNRTNVPLILELALIKSYQHKFDHSMNILKEAIKINPEDSRLYLLAARVNRLDNKPHAALKALDRAMETDVPDFRVPIVRRRLRAHLNIPPDEKEEGER